MAQLDGHLTADQEVGGLTPRQVGNILSWRFDHEIFSTVILCLPLIQEGQLSVSGERMCTILVNPLEEQACPVKVWLGKLTALDWAIKPQHKQNSDKMTYANSADPDQTAPEGAVWSGSTLFAIPLSILRDNCKKQNTDQYGMKCMEWSVWNFRTFTVSELKDK